MTSAYLDRPTRQWAEAQVTYTENSKTMAECLRVAIEGAEKIALSLNDRSDGDSRERAGELAEAIDGLLCDYLKPLEDALQEDYERARHHEENSE